MSVKIINSPDIDEGTGEAALVFYLEDRAGAKIPLTAIQTLRYWLDVQSTGATINGRSDVDIKNANGATVVEVTEDGRDRTKVTVPLASADNPIVDSTLRSEWHLATVKCTFNGGAGVIPKQMAFKVVNLSR